MGLVPFTLLLPFVPLGCLAAVFFAKNESCHLKHLWVKFNTNVLVLHRGPRIPSFLHVKDIILSE